MTLGRLGVWYSTDKLNGSQLADFVGVVEKSGYSALWYPESRGYESMSLAGYLLSKSTQAHHRQLDRQHLCARFLYRAAGHGFAERSLRRRFILGLGVSHIPMVEGLRGHRYDKPLVGHARLSRRHPQGSAVGPGGAGDGGGARSEDAGAQRREIAGRRSLQRDAQAYRPGGRDPGAEEDGWRSSRR